MLATVLLLLAAGGPLAPDRSGRCLAAGTPPANGLSRAGQPVASANGKIYVADEMRGTVSVVAAATHRTVATISLAYAHGDMAMPVAPHNVQAAPDGRTVWVTGPPPMWSTDCGDGDSIPPPQMPPGMGETVFVIDPLADTILARIMLLPNGSDTMLHLAHVVLDRDSRFAYITANSADQVIRIDARTFEEVGRYELGTGRGPHGMRFCRDRLVVANLTGKSLATVDPATGDVADVPVGGAAVQVACTANGRSAFATLYDTREVVRYDLDGGAVSRISLPAEARGPVQLYLAPDDRRLYVADQGVLFGRPASNQLYEIDVGRGIVSGAVRVGRAPHGVVVSDDGQFAYVTNVWDSNVSVVDLRTLKEIATVSVGEAPNGISYWPGIGGATSALR
jgi:YVTN family beta-propeller protein